jgi:hypothetical protein
VSDTDADADPDDVAPDTPDFDVEYDVSDTDADPDDDADVAFDPVRPYTESEIIMTTVRVVTPHHPPISRSRRR